MLALGQRAVGTTATFVCALPPGASRLTLVAGTVATGFFVGAVPPGGTATSGITTSTGAFIPASGSVTYDNRPGAAGADIYAVASAATVASYHITTDG
jgi:hypothetical protein